MMSAVPQSPSLQHVSLTALVHTYSWILAMGQNAHSAEASSTIFLAALGPPAECAELSPCGINAFTRLGFEPCTGTAGPRTFLPSKLLTVGSAMQAHFTRILTAFYFRGK